VRSLALLFFVLLVACGSTKLHVEESPTRRLGGSFVAKIASDLRSNERWAIIAWRFR
jgi:hypothetical protein